MRLNIAVRERISKSVEWDTKVEGGEQSAEKRDGEQRMRSYLRAETESGWQIKDKVRIVERGECMIHWLQSGSQY